MLSEIIIGLIFAAGGVILAYSKGKRDADTSHELDKRNEYIATRAKIESAIPGGDPDDIRDGLRDRDPNKR